MQGCLNQTPHSARNMHFFLYQWLACHWFVHNHLKPDFSWHNTYALKFIMPSLAMRRPHLMGSSDSEQLTVFLNSAVSEEFTLVTNHFWGLRGCFAAEGTRHTCPTAFDHTSPNRETLKISAYSHYAALCCNHCTFPPCIPFCAHWEQQKKRSGPRFPEVF